MINLAAIIDLIEEFNNFLDKTVPGAFCLLLALLILSYARKKIAKDGFGKGFYLAALASLEAVLLVFIIVYFPILISNGLKNFFEPASIRWVMIYLLGFMLWYMISRSSGRRGLYSILILITVFLLGWFYDRWVGILFVSLPILWIFWHVLGKVAQVLLPASDPDDKNENRQRTMAFIRYLLGVQFPFKVAKSRVTREFEERISGDPTNDYGRPGVVWTWPHQVAGLSRGVQFNKVDGPGTIFTDVFESPIALVDLRTQLRTTAIEAVTLDGMQVPAVVFMAFAIDREKWPKEGWSKAHFAQIKYRMTGSSELDHTQGSYPYSAGRVRAAIGKSSINSSPADGERTDVYWDEWVVKQVEEAAREALIARSLDELWRPRNDDLGVSALDEMAAAIKDIAGPRLEEAGIQLFGARIVNFEFKEDSPIRAQNIMTWSTFWEQQITEAEADAEAIYREEIEKAHAFSKSVLLDAIAESIDAARTINDALPRFVIAQYYFHALEEYMKRQPGLDLADAKKRVEDIKGLLYFRTEGNE
jgi:hypothetical protein